jgi:hypothetical protein
MLVGVGQSVNSVGYEKKCGDYLTVPFVAALVSHTSKTSHYIWLTIALI